MARSTTTVQQILADARMLVGNNDYTNLREETMIVRYNLVMPDIYKRLNAAVARFFDSSLLGTPAAATYAVATDNQTYTAATKRVSVSSGFATDYTGGVIMIADLTDPYAHGVYVARITKDSSGSGYLVVESGPSANVAAGDLAYIVLAPPSGLSHSIAAHRVDEIVWMHFLDAGAGFRKDEDVIEGLNTALYANAVSWVQSGASDNGVVKVYAGSSTTNRGGFPLMFFLSLPRPAVTVSEYVDLPSEYHWVLIEEIARRTLLQLGQKVPSHLENPLGAIDALVKG